MTDIPMNIQIKKLRKKLHLTQVDFAKRAGVGLRFLRKLEEGKPTVRLDKVNQVLDFLGFHLVIERNDRTKSESADNNSNLKQGYERT
ncbi:MAG: helix-turn-helix transcriptional regulator [Candidatus Omnitrophica bacterium]|nr:helix-turn-helix transcriptional regulator [Candidatus Omnitrophota bacterium]